MVDKWTSFPQWEGVWKSEGKFHIFLPLQLDRSDESRLKATKNTEEIQEMLKTKITYYYSVQDPLFFRLIIKNLNTKTRRTAVLFVLFIWVGKQNKNKYKVLLIISSWMWFLFRAVVPKYLKQTPNKLNLVIQHERKNITTR
jgi:hypothetical protein